MQKRYTTRLITGLLAAVLIAAGLMTANAQNSKEKEIKNAGKTASKATKALNELMKIPADSIPEGLLKDAKAIAVFPNVLKAAFGIGGSGGKGLISRRTKNGWSAPAVFKLASGSVGFQIGASSTDIVLLFMTDGSLKNLLEDRFEIGAEASAAAGPVGRTAKASTDAQLQAAILSYSRSKGLFAGVSLNGAVISPDNDANQALYAFDAKEILTGEDKIAIASIPSATKNFQQAVTRHAK
jgi:SH3 domain-containing YSC84-like protein 1